MHLGRSIVHRIAALSLLLAGCDSRVASRGAWTTAAAIASPESPLAEALAPPPLAERLVEDGRGGAMAHAWSTSAKRQGLTFGARVPTHADGAIDVGLATTGDATNGTRGDFVLALRHEGLAHASLVNDAGRATYHDVAPSTDLLVRATDAQVEWLYLLRDAAAKSTFAIDVELPRGLPHARTRRDGSLAFLDARDHARLAIAAPFAIDARGVKRDVTLAWDAARARIDLSIDTRGLAFPVLIDPSVEHPVWEHVTIGSPSPRYSASMAYDSARGTSFLFGGTGSGGHLGDTWEWDGTTWQSQAPSSAPSNREGASMAYDSTRRKVVLFGGYEGGGARLDDTWEWDGSSWTERAVSVAPSARSSAPMAYDSARGKIVLFGGTDSDTNQPLGDAWEWDGASWTARTFTQGPSARAGASMVYDAARAVTLLFGGVTVNSQVNDLWSWDGTHWSQASPSTAPSARANAAMAYDSARKKSVLFGGDYLNDTWEWDGTSWTLATVASPPQVRSNSAMTYDSKRQVTVLFGGQVYPSPNASVGDTWEWNGTTWTQREVSPSPGARAESVMAFDSHRSQTVIFSGYAATNDTWEWNGASWAQRSPTSNPAARANASMAYDAARAKTVLFGGVGSGGYLGDTGTWDGTTWTNVTPASSPSARQGGAMAYDSARQRTVLFGGQSSGGFLNDTWEWDGRFWSPISPSAPPSVRQFASMAYDSAHARSVLFGGGNGTTYLGDTWGWDGTTWVQFTPSLAPPPRSQATMAYDSIRGRTVLFGGGDGGLLDDTWEWDGSAWTQISTVSPSGRYASAMAFDSTHGAVVLFSGSSGVNDTWLYFTIGASCTTTSTCDTGTCLDGVCCNQSQCGACQACNLVGTEGLCTNVAAGTIPTTGDVGTCASPQVCTASGLCGSALGSTCSAGTDCVSGFCVDGVCCDTACTGDCQACGTSRGLAQNGTCAFAPEGRPGRAVCAGALACNGRGPACPTTCTDDASCATGFYCDASGACVAKKVDGATCNDAAGSDCLTSGCAECATGNCVDGACCATCRGTTALGAACTNDASCLSNHCVGGSCCSDTCTVTSDGGAGGTCAIGTCHNATFTCTLPGPETVCTGNTCTGGTQSFITACDGKGGCGVPQTKACAPFACGETECKTSCLTTADCAAQATCNTVTNKCEYGATCSTDGTSVVSNNGATSSCSPYVCEGDACATRCASVKDCAAGFECSGAGACVAPSSTTAPSSGCSCRTMKGRSTTTSTWGSVLLVTLFVCARRRKRRSSTTLTPCSAAPPRSH